jgi:roadblock/LC7 domain-containing protein
MSVVSELMSLPGVIAAGEYAFRGDRYSYEGNMTDEMARMASIMCRATSLGVHMESQMLGTLCAKCGLSPSRGWAVRGPAFTVCVMSNYFCFLDNQNASLNDTLHLMLTELKDESDDMI